MILVRFLSSAARVGISAVPQTGVRAQKLSENLTFTAAAIFACFGVGVSTMGLTQLSNYRNTHKIE